MQLYDTPYFFVDITLTGQSYLPPYRLNGIAARIMLAIQR
jgi:hypothetical protein